MTFVWVRVDGGAWNAAGHRTCYGAVTAQLTLVLQPELEMCPRADFVFSI